MASAVFVFVGNPSANTLHVSYAGGIQTGTFKIVGDAPLTAYIDTVIIDENLLITNFRAGYNNFNGCASPPISLVAEIGFFIGTQAGAQGKLGSKDTVWTNAVSFPDSLLPLDKISEPGYTLNKQFGDSLGLNAATITTGGYCQDAVFNFIPGYKNIIYFQYNNGSGERYGKLMIYEVDSAFYNISSAVNITSFDFVYTISNTKNLDTGPVNLYPFNESIRKVSNSGSLFDPVGRRFREGLLPNRSFISIPLLIPRH